MQFDTHLRGTTVIVRVYAAQIVQPLLPWVLEPDELAALCGQIALHSFGAGGGAFIQNRRLRTGRFP